MAVFITDRRTIIDQADSTTGWTGGGFGVETSDVAEETGAVAAALNIATGQVYFGSSAIDVSDTLVYIWLFNNALQDSWTAGPTSLLLGDGTNQIAFHLAGGDRKIFAHLEGPVSWQAAVLDGGVGANTKNSAGEITAVAGSYASLNKSAITQWGGHFITNSKALGGGFNVAVDIIRYGNDGLKITGGNNATRGTFLQLASNDRSISTLAGHGTVRELQPVAFGVQGPLTFGDSGNTAESYFEDSSISIIFENWDIGDNRYYFNVEGNVSTNNVFSLSGSTITTAGPNVSMDLTGGSANIDSLSFTNMTFSQLGNDLIFANGDEASNHFVTSCTFDGCGQINPGKINFTDSTIQNSANASNGAVLLDSDNSSRWSGLTFVGGTGKGHGIYISEGDADDEYDLNNITFTDFGADGTSDAAIYNDSGTAITLNILGGDTPTVNNGPGSSTTIVNAVTLELTNIETDSEVAIFDLQTTFLVANNESITGTCTAAKIAGGGSSYAVSDVLTVVGGTFSTVTQLTVSSVSSGEITGVTISQAGAYSVNPTNPVSVTGGSGSGATFNLTYKGTLSYNYNAVAGQFVDIIVFHLDFKDFRLASFELPTESSSILVQQITDRVYLNP